MEASPSFKPDRLATRKPDYETDHENTNRINHKRVKRAKLSCLECRRKKVMFSLWAAEMSDSVLTVSRSFHAIVDCHARDAFVHGKLSNAPSKTGLN